MDEPAASQSSQAEFSAPLNVLLSWLHRLWDYLRKFNWREGWIDILHKAAVSAPRVLLIIFDPVISEESGKRLSEIYQWNNPDQLAMEYIAELIQCSYGYARPIIVDRISVDYFPVKSDGFNYTYESYDKVWKRSIPPHDPDEVDYSRIIDDYHILERIRKDIDEVWMFGFPYSGFYESRMVGKGAFWCNAPALNIPKTKRFIIMGFSYERGVGEMLESFGHRAESILNKVYSRKSEEKNLYIRFSWYDKLKPGQANCGSIHYAPNSEKDYDWNNTRLVVSNCDDWLNFPNMKGVTRLVNCTEWGNGDIRLHHRWWLQHLPHADGKTDYIYNNWWRYIMDPNQVEVSGRVLT